MTDNNKYDSLIGNLKDCRSDAVSIGYEPWLEAIDDLLFDVTRTSKTEPLEDEWNAYFKTNVAPIHEAFLKANPDMTIVFGYQDIESQLPNTITFEDPRTGFSRTRPFDPVSTDMIKLLHTFADEVFQ